MTATVFDNAMTAHVWAQQTQNDGKSHNGNLWFTGRTIYSYGTHFPLATFAADGSLFINADSSSKTTNGKHFPAVRRAVRGRDAWSVPDLRALIASLDCVKADGRIPAEYAGARARLVEYLDSNWRSFPADSEAAAWLLRAAGSRAAWANVRGKLEAAATKAERDNAKRAARIMLEAAKRLAVVPLDMLRLRMIQTASNASDWNRERQLKEAVREYADAHRAAPAGKLRVALWARVKLARELADRFNRNSSGAFAKRRAAIATLRRIWAGDYGANVGESAALNVALAERGAIVEALEAHGPQSLRERADSRLVTLAGEIQTLTRAREAARMAEQEAERLAWLRNDPEGPRRAYHLKDVDGGALVRALEPEIDGCTVRGGTLETSQGATVPLRHAARVFAFVRALRDKAQADGMADCARVWIPGADSVRVGHFALSEVYANGDFVAGCHRINWSETERLSRELGLWDCPATALSADAE